MKPAPAADGLRRLGLERAPGLAVITGSGWREATERLDRIAAIDLASLPGCRAPEIEGHGGELVRCRTQRGCELLVATGRVHLYEGCCVEEITALIDHLARMGVRRLLLTNAAGGLDSTLRPGDVVAIGGDLNLTWRRAVRAEAIDPPLYDPGLIETFLESAREAGMSMRRGVYAAVTGPNFETRAEIAMLRRLGATVVGMSTSLEARAARARGMRVGALSLVTNRCSERPSHGLDHREVLDVARGSADALASLLAAIVDAQDGRKAL